MDSDDDFERTGPAVSEANPADATRFEDNSVGRLLTLSDGIFAIAMTLLSLDLKVPDVSKMQLAMHGDSALRGALSDNMSSYLTFLLSFYIIANYWLRHRQLMRSLVVVHPVLIRDTLALLFVVAAMPFFASLLSKSGSQPTALALYAGANVLAILALISLDRDVHRLGLADRNDPGEPRGAYWTRWQTWATLAVFALCIPASYVLGSHGPWALLLLVVPSRISGLSQLYHHLRGRRARRHQSSN